MNNCGKYLRDNTYKLKKKLNILIVDNDRDSTTLFKNILETRGHRVKIVDEGIRTINCVQNNIYDIIFLDYNIGDIDGLTLIELIKDINEYETLIFCYSGNNSNKIINKFKNTGVNGLLIKPINTNKINKIFNLFETIKTNTMNEFKTNKIIDGSIIFF